MSIKDWPADDRPREKLLELGADALSDADWDNMRAKIKAQNDKDRAGRSA